MDLRRHFRRTDGCAKAVQVCLVCVFVPVCCGSAWAQQTTSEYQIEAAYLYNFAKAAKWSQETLPDRGYLIIGVMGGEEEFVKVLRDVLRDKAINGHASEVRHIHSAEEVRFCHVVFFRVPEPATRAVLAQIRKSNILLVGKDKEFLNDGGMINLTSDDGKISYELNAAALERANVRYGDPSAVAPKTDEQIPTFQSESSRPVAFRATPEYSRLAASLKLAGSVQLQAVVRADGTVKQVKVIGGHPVLAKAAAAALIRWRFEAGPRETTESVKISFGE